MEGREQVVDDAIGGTEQDPILLVTFVVVVVVVVFFVELEWWWRVVESSLVCTTIWLVDSYRCILCDDVCLGWDSDFCCC